MSNIQQTNRSANSVKQWSNQSKRQLEKVQGPVAKLPIAPNLLPQFESANILRTAGPNGRGNAQGAHPVGDGKAEGGVVQWKAVPADIAHNSVACNSLHKSIVYTMATWLPGRDTRHCHIQGESSKMAGHQPRLPD